MHPGIVAPHLPEFAQPWCQALHEIRDNEEKDSAYRGFCTLVQTNPAGMAKVIRCIESSLIFHTHEPLKSLLWFCNAIVRWNQLLSVSELSNMFKMLLQGFKQSNEAEWAAQVASFPPVIQQRLAARYGV